jgi:transposase
VEDASAVLSELQDGASAFSGMGAAGNPSGPLGRSGQRAALGDRAYDSDDLDEDMRGMGIKMVSPQRKNRKKPKTQDGRELRRYKRRWIVERFFAWIKHKRRLLNRWEFHPENFLGFVQVSAVLVLLKQF